MKFFILIFILTTNIFGTIIEYQNEYGDWLIHEKENDNPRLIFTSYQGEKHLIRYSHNGRDFTDPFNTFKKFWEESKIDKSGYRYFDISYPGRYDESYKAYLEKYMELTSKNERQEMYDIYMGSYSEKYSKDIIKENFKKLSDIKDLVLKENDFYKEFFLFLEEKGYKLVNISTEKHGFVEDNIYMPFMVHFQIEYMGE